MDAVCDEIMLCLHSKPAGKIKNEKGFTLWVCQQPSTCHFSCSEDQKYLYGGAVVVSHHEVTPQIWTGDIM